jgi:hypothetical protein
MNKQIPEDLDMRIEEALKGDRFLHAPDTFHRRVEERIRIAALSDREKTRFRYSLISLAAAFLAVLAVAGLAVFFTNFGGIMTRGVAGGKGQYDYYATSMIFSWTAYSGAWSLILSLLAAGGTMLLGLIPLRHFLTRAS